MHGWTRGHSHTLSTLKPTTDATVDCGSNAPNYRMLWGAIAHTYSHRRKSACVSEVSLSTVSPPTIIHESVQSVPQNGFSGAVK